MRSVVLPAALALVPASTLVASAGVGGHASNMCDAYWDPNDTEECRLDETCDHGSVVGDGPCLYWAHGRHGAYWRACAGGVDTLLVVAGLGDATPEADARVLAAGTCAGGGGFGHLPLVAC